MAEEFDYPPDQCGCDGDGFLKSTQNYVHRTIGKSFPEQSEFDFLFYTYQNRLMAFQAGFDPFSYNSNSGIWNGTLFGGNGDVFGYKEPKLDCLHNTERARFIELIKFYKRGIDPYLNLINSILPQPIAEEIVPEFLFRHTFNNVTLLPNFLENFDLLLECYPTCIELRDESTLVELSEWYIQIQEFRFHTVKVFKWVDGRSSLSTFLQKIFNEIPSDQDLSSMRNIIDWIIKHPNVRIEDGLAD